MAWLKIDDRYPSNMKIVRAGIVGMALDLAGMCYASAYETDGFLDDSVMRALLPGQLTPAKRRQAIATLIEVGRWTRDDERGGYWVHDFLDYNPSAADRQAVRERAEAQRKYDTQRAAMHRDKALLAAVRKRDGSHCRYCWDQVDWKDRKSPGGGTYDHVEPRGPNTVENLVVACRSCNSRKWGRTPEEAGMELRPPWRGSTENLRRIKSKPTDNLPLSPSRPHPRPAEGGDGDPPKPPHPPPSGPASPPSATPGGDADSAGHPQPPPSLASTDAGPGDPPAMLVPAANSANGALPPEVSAGLDAALGPAWRRRVPAKTGQDPAVFEAEREQKLNEFESAFAQELNENDTETGESEVAR